MIRNFAFIASLGLIVDENTDSLEQIKNRFKLNEIETMFLRPLFPDLNTYKIENIDGSPYIKKEKYDLLSTMVKLDDNNPDIYGTITGDKLSCYFSIIPQFHVERYRLDFLFRLLHSKTNELLFYAVEIDGHDFHEKTKQQVSMDKKRERDLSRLGYKVIRFTGSEVYGDPVKCFSDMIDIGMSDMDRRIQK